MRCQPRSNPIEAASRFMEPWGSSMIGYTSGPGFRLSFRAKSREDQHLLRTGHGDIEQAQLFGERLGHLLFFGQPEAEARTASARLGRMHSAAHSKNVVEDNFLLRVGK